MSETAAAPRAGRLDSIQALRAIAAVLVLVQHATVYVLMARNIDFKPYLQIDFGRMGVLLFFVISGFVMATCLDQGRRFLALRAMRIYPAFWLAIGCSALLLAPTGLPWHYNLLSAFLIPHQFPNTPYAIPYWTLVYEAVFYVVTYGLILLGGSRKIVTAGLLGWLAVVIAANRYANIPLLVPGAWILLSPLNAFYIVGMLACLHREPLFRIPATALAVFAAVAWTLGTSLQDAAPMAGQMVLACAYCAVLLLAIRFRSPAILVRLGDWSYGLYLLHVPVIGLAIYLLGAWAPGLRTSWTWLAVFSSALLAGFAFGWAEHRIHGVAKRLLRRRAVADGQPSRLSLRRKSW
ncbi:MULTISPECIES: acyltransferase family protein [Ramlibacter]|uniref:acyltransferase family protein n=1 Tax=Ramlibacter TaxID=174951 RepID=UPI0012FA68AC|nr:acyltransferase [Ramlibacter sp. CGMCC 1.13660]